MKVLLTGGTGYLGGFIDRALREAGHAVTHLSRRAPPDGQAWLPFELGAHPPALPPADALVHGAFSHLPGRYRGGEGDDPEGFLARNSDGSAALLEAAAAAGVGRAVFLSSRAVYGGYPDGTRLVETMPQRPDTLYGTMKAAVEAALAACFGANGTSLRVTGVYGRARPGGWHKWAGLFADFEAGLPVAPRRATEVHGDDMAAAICLALCADPLPATLNVSDLMVDRHDLLAQFAACRGLDVAPPPPAPGPGPAAMETDVLRALGWRPGGTARLSAFLAEVTQGPA